MPLFDREPGTFLHGDVDWQGKPRPSAAPFWGYLFGILACAGLVGLSLFKIIFG